MRSMSSELQMQFYHSEHEIDFGGVEQLTRVPLNEFTSNSGRVARRFHTRGGLTTKAADLSAHGFHVGDSVEVDSAHQDHYFPAY